MYIYANISLGSFQHEKRLDKSCKENQNTHFVFHTFFFFRKSWRLCDDDDDDNNNNNNNIKQLERSQMIM